MAAVADDRHHIGPDDAVTVHRPPDSAISHTVLFPVTEAQRNGLEDLRLVRFVHDDGRTAYIGTYTAHSGQATRSELLLTRDFASRSATRREGKEGVCTVSSRWSRYH